jgi:hypothetical protein
MPIRGSVDPAYRWLSRSQQTTVIEKRHDQRKTEEGHTPSEELWKASVERYKQDGFGYGDGQRSSA